MHKLLLISCLFGFMCAFPLNPWDLNFIPQEQPKVIYALTRPYYDATIFQRPSEWTKQLTANLICASLPVGGPYFAKSEESSPISTIQSVPISNPSYGKVKEENRDISMIKLNEAEPRVASGSSIEAEKETTKIIDVPEPNDKAIPVGCNENADGEEEQTND